MGHRLGLLLAPIRGVDHRDQQDLQLRRARLGVARGRARPAPPAAQGKLARAWSRALHPAPPSGAAAANMQAAAAAAAPDVNHRFKLMALPLKG